MNETSLHLMGRTCVLLGPDAELLMAALLGRTTVPLSGSLDMSMGDCRFSVCCRGDPDWLGSLAGK